VRAELGGKAVEHPGVGAPTPKVSLANCSGQARVVTACPMVRRRCMPLRALCLMRA
jgi:hypothetical protein